MSNSTLHRKIDLRYLYVKRKVDIVRDSRIPELKVRRSTVKNNNRKNQNGEVLKSFYCPNFCQL